MRQACAGLATRASRRFTRPQRARILIAEEGDDQLPPGGFTHAHPQLLSGWLHSEGNGNFDANATGHVWGTFRLELDSGGVWIGSWVVDRTKVDGVNTWVGRGKFVGRGISGDVHGMHVRFSEILISFMPLPVAYVGSIDARVLVPPPPQ
jgi:hypothetical protein